MTPPTSSDLSDLVELPDVIRRYLAAHGVRDTDAALRTFGPDAVVTDQGRTFRGTDEVRSFLSDAGAEFEYTTELVGADRVDGEHWVVHNRLEGDFPGGVADLSYRFTTDGERITELVITG